MSSLSVFGFHVGYLFTLAIRMSVPTPSVGEIKKLPLMLIMIHMQIDRFLIIKNTAFVKNCDQPIISKGSGSHSCPFSTTFDWYFTNIPYCIFAFLPLHKTAGMPGKLSKTFSQICRSENNLFGAGSLFKNVTFSTSK